jgi:hypothetical protein
MTIDLITALSRVEQAAREIFAADPAVRSVGVSEASDGVRFVAVRNVRAPVALSARTNSLLPRTDFEGIPVTYQGSLMDPVQLARVPHSGAGSPGVGSVMPEQQPHLPLACGLQIQNYDDDMRSGEIDRGYITVGTLGCFVQLAGGEVAILSNNHVVAGQNRGVAGKDRIAHPGSKAFTPASQIATLTHFTALRPSPLGASIADDNAVLNDIDAGVAVLQAGIEYSQAYLAGRMAAAPRGIATAAVGDKVCKVGRTTGLTYGTVTQVGAVVGPVPYAPGPCWFRHAIVIEGDKGVTFSDHGDSGSAIVRSDGMVLGLLYAGNGIQAYACTIGDVLMSLECELA